MTETKWTRRICDELKACNADVTAIVGGNYRQRVGLPDRYVLHTSWNGWLEFKGPATKLTALQRRFIRLHEDKWPTTAYVVREGDSDSQCAIEDSTGRVVSCFDDTGLGLLRVLSRLRYEAVIRNHIAETAEESKKMLDARHYLRDYDEMEPLY